MAVRRGQQSTGPDRVIRARDILRALRRGAPFALVLAVVAGATAYYASSVATPTYEAQVGVVASQPGSQYSDLGIITPPTVDAGVYQSAILEGDVVPEALSRVDGAPSSQDRLRRLLEAISVRVEAGQRSSTIWIDVRHSSPDYAADVANAIAEELVIWDRERARRAVDRSIAAIERSIADLDARIAQADGDEAGPSVSALSALREQRAQELATALQTSSAALVVGLLEPLRAATPPDEPIAPRVTFTTFVAVLLALVLGYAVQILRWTVDARIGDRDDVIAETGLPVLAEFPKRSRRSTRLSPEASGFFHANVALATRDANPRTIVVASPQRPEEKAGVAMSLAENFARSGTRTLLVDADLRHPGATERLGVGPDSAVTFDAYLATPDRTLEPVSVAVGSRQSFDFVPSFTSERFPVDLLNEGFERCLRNWAGVYDVVVLDSAPVLPFADTLSIAPSCTGVVLCASSEVSTREHLDDALGLLDRPHVKVLGIALTDVRGGPRPSAGGRRPGGSATTPSGRTRSARRR